MSLPSFRFSTDGPGGRGLFLGMLVVTLAAACGGPTPGSWDVQAPGSAGQAIFGGQLSTVAPHVVALTQQERAFCSGTLVHRRVVLTAAHCIVDRGNLMGDLQVISAFFGNDPQEGDGPFIPTISQQVHPDYEPPDINLQGSSLETDIGMLVLNRDAPVEPIGMASAAFDSSFIGRDVLIMGFGRADDGDTKEHKREAVVDVQDYDGRMFFASRPGVTTCSGDSGGPSFLDEGGASVIAGVHSAIYGNCGSGFGAEVRVDRYREELIDPYIAEVDELLPPEVDPGPDTAEPDPEPETMRTDPEPEAEPLPLGCWNAGSSSWGALALFGCVVCWMPRSRRRSKPREASPSG